MAATLAPLKTWTFGAFSIVKIRDEDGITYDVLRDGEEESLGHDSLADARAYVRDSQNTELVDRVEDLLAGLDLETAAATKKLEAMIRFLEK